MEHIGNFVRNVGNVAGHVGNVVSYLGNVAGYLGNVVRKSAFSAIDGGTSGRQRFRRGAGGSRSHQSSSAPSRQNGFRLHHFFRGTGEVAIIFSRAAADEEFNGVQAAGLHPKAELLGDFAGVVLLKAFGHVGASAPADPIAMYSGTYFRRVITARHSRILMTVLRTSTPTPVVNPGA